MGLKGLFHGFQIERKFNRRRSQGAFGGASLKEQNAIVHAGYCMAEQVPNFRRQQRIMHARVTEIKRQRNEEIEECEKARGVTGEWWGAK